MQFSSSKKNRKARGGGEGGRGDIQCLGGVSCGVRKGLHRRPGARAGRGLLPRRPAPRTLAVPTGNCIQTSVCIINPGQLAAPQGSPDRNCEGIRGHAGQCLRRPRRVGSRCAGLGPRDDVHFSALHFVLILKCTPRQGRSASIIHQKAERLASL